MVALSKISELYD
jgi:hypothetical protein